MGRFLPLVRSLISVPAGMAKLPLVRFVTLTAIASLIWNSVLVVAGAAAADHLPRLMATLAAYDTVAYAGLALLALGLFGWYWKKQRQMN